MTSFPRNQRTMTYVCPTPKRQIPWSCLHMPWIYATIVFTDVHMLHIILAVMHDEDKVYVVKQGEVLFQLLRIPALTIRSMIRDFSRTWQALSEP